MLVARRPIARGTTTVVQTVGEQHSLTASTAVDEPRVLPLSSPRLSDAEPDGWMYLQLVQTIPAASPDWPAHTTDSPVVPASHSKRPFTQPTNERDRGCGCGCSRMAAVNRREGCRGTLCPLHTYGRRLIRRGFATIRRFRALDARPARAVSLAPVVPIRLPSRAESGRVARWIGGGRPVLEAVGRV